MERSRLFLSSSRSFFSFLALERHSSITLLRKTSTRILQCLSRCFSFAFLNRASSLFSNKRRDISFVTRRKVFEFVVSDCLIKRSAVSLKNFCTTRGSSVPPS
jgi:hypothetical protein